MLHQPSGLGKQHFQGFGIHRLEQVSVKARLFTTATVFLLPIAGERPESGSAWAPHPTGRAKLSGHLVAIHPRKSEVE
jgi:hypothetical protein